MASANHVNVELPKALEDRKDHDEQVQDKPGEREGRDSRVCLHEIPVPQPFEAAEWVTTHPVTAHGLHRYLRMVSYYLVHNVRVLGHTPMLVVLLGFWRKQVLAAVATYFLMRRLDRFNTAVHHFARFGSSNRPRFLRAQRAPYDTNKQYIMSHHPHGILLCPWFTWASREELPSETDPADRGFSTSIKAMDGVRFHLCVAPAVSFYSLHGEMYRDKVHDAQASTMRRILRGKEKDSLIICPGGFSEAVYTGYSSKYEVAYLKERYGFLKVAIEEGVDIIPTYSFGAADMYWGWDWNRHERAKLSQKCGLPMVVWSGRYGTNMPLFEDTVTVSFDPFPAASYTLDELEQAHADYCAYLKSCFDAYKGCCATTASKELIFVGKNDPPPPQPPTRSSL